ncbi:hypothetical protein M758_UG026700 [Ceratodon purpureus]|nr:hypothetical protein M758_UG026700 [Ceratodon purpureus]
MAVEWMLLPLPTGTARAPRCGHSATMVEKRMLIFGGRGGGGLIMGDLWALKGLFDEGRDCFADFEYFEFRVTRMKIITKLPMKVDYRSPCKL